MTPRLVDLYPDKAQYAPGQEIGIVAEIRGPDGEAAPVTLHVTVRDLLAEVQTISQAAVATAGAAHRLRIGLAGRQVAWRGYGVDAALECGGEVVDRRSTSFDVADSWRRSPRYGFLADFGPEAAGEAPGDAEDVAWLCRLHLNVAQFYDWMYRHDTLLPPADEYTDPMGKRKSLRAVRGRLAACHAAGIRAIAYGAVYAATEAFAREHLQWALRDGDGRPITFIDRFTLMSIAPDSPWRAHIVEQFARAISELGFDGIHLDAYGFPKTATSLTSGAPRVERLQEHFPALIDATRQRLPDAGLIFNNVSGWPVSTTAPAGVDAVYIEVWPPAERYGHVVEIIHQARVFGGGKPVILAAYLAPFARPEPGALAALQLLWAVIAAHGASQLVLGGHQGVLTRPYYPDYALLSGDPARAARDYADFVVRYAALLFDPALQDVSMTHAGGDSREYRFTGFSCSQYCRPATVWCVIRESRGWKTISFINLSGVSDDLWNSPKETPRVVRDLDVSIEVVEPVRSVFVASPDIDGGRPRELEHRLESGLEGRRLLVRVPEVAFWTLLAVEVTEGSTCAGRNGR